MTARERYEAERARNDSAMQVHRLADAALAEAEAENDNLRDGLNNVSALLDREREEAEARADELRRERDRWEHVAQECLTRGLMGGWQITDRQVFLNASLARYDAANPAPEEEGEK